MNDNLQILSYQSTRLAVRMAVVLTSLVAQDAYALSRWPQAKMSLSAVGFWFSRCWWQKSSKHQLNLGRLSHYVRRDLGNFVVQEKAKHRQP